MEKIKKIDVHAHVTPFPDYAPRVYPGNNRVISAEELLRIYDDLNIEKGVLLPTTTSDWQHELITSSDCKYVTEQDGQSYSQS